MRLSSAQFVRPYPYSDYDALLADPPPASTFLNARGTVAAAEPHSPRILPCADSVFGKNGSGTHRVDCRHLDYDASDVRIYRDVWILDVISGVGGDRNG